MDVYRVKLSDGTVLSVEADHQPTEEEVLRAYHAGANQLEPTKPVVDERTPGQKAIGTAIDTGVGLVKGGIKGVAGALAAPITIPYSIYNKGLMGTAKDMVEGGAGTLNDIVHGDAGTRSEALGELAGNFLVPEELINRGPLAHATARGVGRAVETTGKTAAWPLRITGAHQLASSGNPLGLALMAAPEAVQGLGRRIREWGIGDTTPEGNARAVDKFFGGPRQAPVGPQDVTVMPSQPDIVDRGMSQPGKPNVPTTVEEANASILQGLRDKMAQNGTVSVADLKALRGELARGEKAQLNTENLGKVRAARTGEPQTSFSETTSATNPEGGTERMSTRYTDPNNADFQKRRQPGGDLDPEAILRRAGVTNPNRIAAVAPDIARQLGQPTPEVAPRVEQPTFGGKPLDVGPVAKDTLLKPTQTSREMSGVDDRISANDWEAAREILRKNPNISDKDLSIEIMKRRRGRQDLYRNFPPEQE